MKHEIINNGKPNLKNMSKPEFNVFCKSILDIMIEDKKAKKRKNQAKWTVQLIFQQQKIKGTGFLRCLYLKWPILLLRG